MHFARSGDATLGWSCEADEDEFFGPFWVDGVFEEVAGVVELVLGVQKGEDFFVSGVEHKGVGFCFAAVFENYLVSINTIDATNVVIQSSFRNILQISIILNQKSIQEPAALSNPLEINFQFRLQILFIFQVPGSLRMHECVEPFLTHGIKSIGC